MNDLLLRIRHAAEAGFILVAALSLSLALGGCRGSDDDDVPDDGQHPHYAMPISIGGGQEGAMLHATRATHNLEDLLPEGHKDFRVWAFKTMNVADGSYTDPQTVMDRYIVKWSQGTAGTTASNTADWEYVGVANDYLGAGAVQTIKYWDLAATSYRFFGFAPHDESKVEYTYPSTHVGDGNVWYDIMCKDVDASAPDAAPYISSMWFSRNTAADAQRYGDCVTMTFMKPVCRVRIVLIDDEGEISDLASKGITSLSFLPASGDPIVQKGNLKVSYAVTGPVTEAYYTPSVVIVGDPSGTVSIPEVLTSHYSDFTNVLPHVVQGAYQLTMIQGDKTKLATVPSTYMSWKPNVEYTYMFKLTEYEFQFIDIVQIGVTEWRTESSIHEIYNW